MNFKSFSFALVLFYSFSLMGCYTIVDSPAVIVPDNEDEDLITEGVQDTVIVASDYTVINNYSCSNGSSCCQHDYCHTSSHSHGYHNCVGSCHLEFNWWTGTWISYSCNYCHHHSCSGHHYGDYYGHGYYHHGYHDGYYDGYWWGYHDGYYDGYWWGSDNNSSGNNNDYSHNEDRQERRQNSFDRTVGNDDTVYNLSLIHI